MALRDELIKAGKQVCSKNQYLNCQFFAQMVTNTERILDLPKVNKAEVGDVFAFGGDGSYANHYAIYLGRDEVMEIEGWGEPMRINKLSKLVNEYEEPTGVYRPNYTMNETSRRPGLPKRLPTLETYLTESEVSVSEAARMDTSTLGLHVYGNTFLLYNFPVMDGALTEYDYDKIEEAVVGVVETRNNGEHDAVEVDSIWGAKGYGPLLFLIAMELAKPKKLIMTRRINKTSDDAKRVWKEFYDGRGKNLVDKFELEKKDSDKEDFLNYAMTNKSSIDIRGMESLNRKILADDRYGEKKDTLEETGESKLFHEMGKIYG